MTKKSNILTFVVRGRITEEYRNWLLSSKELDDGETADVVEWAIGYESESQEHHEHTHVVLRLSKQVSSDMDTLRWIWDLDKWQDIQHITIARPPREDFEWAARYACRTGDYEWPSQVIHPPYDMQTPNWNYMQRTVLKEMQGQNHRQILCVVEKKGNTGKSFLANWLERRFQATIITVNRSYKDVLREAYCFHKKNYMNLRKVFVDIPKAFPQKELRFLFAAVETLKDGRITDDRYQNQLEYIESPQLCIFTNEDAPINALTEDRWRIMVVHDENHFDLMDYDSYSRYLEKKKKDKEHAQRQREYRERQKLLNIQEANI